MQDRKSARVRPSCARAASGHAAAAEKRNELAPLGANHCRSAQPMPLIGHSRRFWHFRARSVLPSDSGGIADIPDRPLRVKSGCEQVQKQTFWPAYSMTSSASVRRLSEILISSDLATLRLISSSNLSDCTTGSSAGLAPLRILPA